MVEKEFVDRQRAREAGGPSLSFVKRTLERGALMARPEEQEFRGICATSSVPDPDASPEGALETTGTSH